MSHLWVEIETLVLNGVPLNASQGRRLAELTEIALARLLEQRGTATRLSSGESSQPDGTEVVSSAMRVPPNTNEARWAEELALTLYRAVDRSCS
jgi:hypothetical protein